MCYDNSQEVNVMEDKIIEREEPQEYHRPVWQRIVAVIGLIVVLVGFLLYCYQIANGGM